MRFASLAGIGLAGLGTLVLAPASGTAAPKPPFTLVAPPAAHAGPAARPRRKGRDVTAGGCTSDYPSAYFVGIPGAKDVAGGNVSGVLSGYANEACDVDDAIGSGYLNIIGGTGDSGAAQLSFIGSGQNNAVIGPMAFIGAGQNNGVSGNGAFVGAGEYGQAIGDSSFVGAGVGDHASGVDAFAGAGNENGAGGDYSFVGGGDINESPGTYAFVGGGFRNLANFDTAVVVGGEGNTAGAVSAAVVGGNSNSAEGNSAFVGGGSNNSATGAYSVVGGGAYDTVSGNGSFIGAGDYEYVANCLKNPKTCSGNGNTVSGTDSFIGAGDQNTVSASEAFAGGGSDNTIAAQAEWGTIGGGHDNAVSGAYATIPGGSFNAASGLLSFAAGYHADATQTGSFVWSDYVAGSSVVKDSAADQFVVRASGGTYVYSSENLKSGVKLAAGSGTWASLSDRSAKTDIAPLDDASILAKVATLPVSSWRYKTEAGVRHVGPMAQDFYAAFGVGEDDRHITSIDEDGVALAAIKALHRENLRLRADNGNLHAANATLCDRLAALEKKVDALAARP